MSGVKKIVISLRSPNLFCVNEFAPKISTSDRNHGILVDTKISGCCSPDLVCTNEFAPKIFTSDGNRGILVDTKISGCCSPDLVCANEFAPKISTSDGNRGILADTEISRCCPLYFLDAESSPERYWRGTVTNIPAGGGKKETTDLHSATPVSYTHLTLPTKLSV